MLRNLRVSYSTVEKIGSIVDEKLIQTYGNFTLYMPVSLQ